jgi:cytochrome c
MRIQYFYSLAALFLTCCNSVFAQDVSLGKLKFQDCIACHSTNAGENLIGPSLFGVYGRQAGTGEGFRYSNAVKKSGVTWDSNSLNQYIANPQAFIAGGRMPYSGMADEEARKHLIAYLMTLQ